MTAPLTAGDFGRFFAEVHGKEPFPWQADLVESVVDAGRWPDVIDVPTGLGKTAVLDAAVFIAAIAPGIARRRIYLVVDRRLIVDQAHDHARQIQEALRTGKGPVCERIASRLRADGDEPDAQVLDVTRMRGGTTWSWRWLDRPDRHAIITGTIDQIGSRLLFRGYGTGQHLRPIDAALTGTDSLILVDEAHLAAPFVRTVRDAVNLEPPGTWRPPVVVSMSATAPAQRERARVHTISRADEDNDRAGLRLRSPKSLHLLTAQKGTVDKSLAGWAAALAALQDSGKVVVVVCNTVARARAVFTLLREGPAEARLLIGRIRDIDRDYLMQNGWYDRSRTDRTRSTGRPLILVSTQTIEVGADIDADVLISESAALPALVQRLGRLNRAGVLAGSPALVIHDPAATSDDPVYGPARIATWQWLCTLTPPVKLKAGAPLTGGYDVSPLALRRLTGGLSVGEAAAMQPGERYIPVLNEATFDAWAQTSPIPHPDPPVAPFLHGIDDDDERDVSITWRTWRRDLSDKQWADLAALVPPSADEAIQIPVRAARSWLTGAAARAEDFSDLESTAPSGTDSDDTSGPAGRWPVLRYRNRDSIETVSRPQDIRPGDALIVPAGFGGCDEYGWNPRSALPVADVADYAFRHGRPMLRLTASLPGLVAVHHPEMRDAIGDLVASVQDDLAGDSLNAGSYRKTLRELLDAIPPPADPEREKPRLVRNLQVLGRSARVYPYPGGVLLTVRGGGFETDRTALGSSATGTPASLAAHQEAVRARAGEFARNLELDARITATVQLAALLHDEGKRDPRFQAMLYGRPVRLLTPHLEPRAKSGLDPADRAAFRRAQAIGGYPPEMRHEALSARIAALHAQAGGQDIDPDLLIHLVATHHGRGRPLLPPVADPDPRLVIAGPYQADTSETIDWDGPARFARLTRQHGRWGLALLETIVRLADIWCSERDKRAGEEEDSS